MKYLLPTFFLLSMWTIGYLHVGVILLTTRTLWDRDYIKRSTDQAKSRPDGGVLLCELGMCNPCTTRVRDSKCQLYPCACWKWETQQIYSKKLRLTRNQRKIFDSGENDSLLSPGLHSRSPVVSNFGSSSSSLATFQYSCHAKTPN